MSSPTIDEQPSKPARSGIRRAHRVQTGAWVGGVCTAIAAHLGWSLFLVRIAFVCLGLMNFLGVLVYGALWLLLPVPGKTVVAPGLAAGERSGMREAPKPRQQRTEIGALIALIVFGLGLLWLVRETGWGMENHLFWPIALGCGGVALLWRQAETAAAKDEPQLRKHWYSPLVVASGWFAVIRIVMGMVLVGGAIMLLAVRGSDLSALPQMLLVMLLAVVGVGLVIAPWAYRVQQQLSDAREAKIVADARADMAAHLHDSVLQTLALIQRQAHDPKAVASLARRQERELRTWLYGDSVHATQFKAAITQAASDIEAEREVPVEVVVVGDCELSEDTQQLVKAAREAIMNAAKHSGAPMIDVYAEVTDDLIEVFIRDRGKGFNLDSIATDRAGVRKSIIDRMERHGGKAVIRTAPGEGTEVRLEMNR